MIVNLAGAAIAVAVAAVILIVGTVAFTRDKGERAAPREYPLLRNAAWHTARAGTRALAAGGTAVTWTRHAIRKRIARLGASPAVIPAAGNPDLAEAAHMDALQRLDRPWGDDTGSFTKFVAEGDR